MVYEVNDTNEVNEVVANVGVGWYDDYRRMQREKLREKMITQLVAYMQTHDGKLPEHDPKKRLQRDDELEFYLENYARLVGGGSWTVVLEIAQDVYETAQIKAMIEEDHAADEREALLDEREVLLDELMTFTLDNRRLPRFRKMCDNPSDEGNLPHELEIYRAELTEDGKVSEIKALILARLPKDLRFDPITNRIVERKNKKRV